MPIEGFPDSAIHKLCLRCKRWFEPHEGRKINWRLESKTVIGAIGALSVGAMPSERFMCHRCLRIRRWTKIIIFGSFATMTASVMIWHLIFDQK